MATREDQEAAGHDAGEGSSKAAGGHDAGEGSRNITWHESRVCHRRCKESLLGQRGCVLWLTGLSGSGKSTVACELEHTLCSLDKTAVVLDGDNIRHGE